MLEGKVSGINMVSAQQIYVKLLDEMVEVWRPVSATHLGGSIYKIDEQEIPDYEIWEFQPRDIVNTKLRKNFDEEAIVCVEKIGNG